VNHLNDNTTTPHEGVKAEAGAESPWLTAQEAADRARCGVKVIYRAVRAGKLKAAKLGGRHELRLRAAWVDAWLDASAVIA
jgi:excisionase family DNA binding protein